MKQAARTGDWYPTDSRAMLRWAVWFFVAGLWQMAWPDAYGQTTAATQPAVTQAPAVARADNPARADVRLLQPMRNYNVKYHPWDTPATKAAWEAERDRIRQQVLVSLNLWPMPEKTPLNAVVHGAIDKGEYIVEKVYFTSLPGRYVTGNLYRPKHITGKVPGIVNPHGHWPNGRFYELPAERAKKEQIGIGAEKHLSGAQYPVQARMVQLAKMGCIVFHYDMEGYADSTAMPHRSGFNEVADTLWLQEFMGLQTWNSIRALDFLMSLPNVDPDRIGVTGSSGGGTQTFALCAVDNRPAAAFPAVMVSTNMQGGCVCENSSYLRIGVNNIALAALFAPKPMAMSACDDWTIDIATKGLPELQRIYSLYAATDKVRAKCWPEFKHNYNQPAREMMYDWFNTHLKLGKTSPIEEPAFEPIPPAQLSVFDADHPRPSDALPHEDFKKQWRKQSEAQFAALVPTTEEKLSAYRDVIGKAAQVLLDGGLPSSDDVRYATPLESGVIEGTTTKLYRAHISRRDAGERVPFAMLVPADFNGDVVLWQSEAGRGALLEEGKPSAIARKFLDKKFAVATADVFLTGDYLTGPGEAPKYAVNATFPGYTYCYNKPLISERVHDTLTAVAAALKHPDCRKVHLVGAGAAGTWTLLARAAAGAHAAALGVCVADVTGAGFSKISSAQDPSLLPGALKYGGLGGLTALAAPAELVLAGMESVPATELEPLRQVYKVTNSKLHLEPATLPPAQLADRLLQTLAK